MPEGSEANAIMQYAFLKVFAEDGLIDADELAFIERLALRDGKVDDEERRVLRGIFARVQAGTLAPEVEARIAELKRRWEIG